MLTDAVVASGASAGAASTSSAADASAGAPAKTYQLVANASALSPHVGKKLELTGTLESPSGASASSSGSEASGPALRVQSGKVVAASCSQ